MEQLKASVFEYYIGVPSRRAARAVSKTIRKRADKITGRWWCEGCGKYHHGRVIAFYPCELSDGVCGKHIDPEGAEKCEAILMGRRNITEQIKKAVRERKAFKCG